ncbi:MAG: response regulator [Pseudomonadota bacterium]
MTPIEILLIEDNLGDVRLMQEALKEAKIHNHLTVAHNGVEAIAILHKQGQYALAVTPQIILLDLNLPKRSGIEVLAQIKSGALKQIPVIILSSSKADEDVAMSYMMHANCYITKPMDLDQYIKVVRAIKDFWFTIVRLPGNQHG